MDSLTTQTIILYIVTIGICIISSYFNLNIAKYYWETKVSNIFFCSFSAIAIGFTIWSSIFLDNEILFYLILFFVEFILLKLFTHITYSQATFATITVTLNLMSAKGIVVGLLSLFLKKNLYQIITVESTSILSLVLASILTNIFLAIYSSKEKRKLIAVLFNTESELTRLIHILSSLFIFMLFYSYNYYYNLDLVWFSMAQVILSALVLILYFQVLSYSLRISNLLEVELYHKQVESHLNIQLAQYQNHKEMVHSINNFKHQYREKLMTIEALLASKQVDSALNLIRDSSDNLIEELSIAYMASNHDLINGVLFAWKNSSNQNNTPFDAHIFISKEIEPICSNILKILTIIEVLFGLLTVNNQKSNISIVGKSRNNLFVLKATCTIAGSIYDRNSLPFFVSKNGLDANHIIAVLVQLLKVIMDLFRGNIIMKFHHLR